MSGTALLMVRRGRNCLCVDSGTCCVTIKTGEDENYFEIALNE